MNTKLKHFIPDNKKVIIQGITGKEGMRGASGMLHYGTLVVAGVTPGKGGGSVEGVPVFNTIQEALHQVGAVGAIVQFVPPLHALTATKEAIASGVPLIHIGAERVPVLDAIAMCELGVAAGSMLIGPGSVGMIVPRLNWKLGMIGGDNPSRTFQAGNIAVLSKSGGMTSEIGLMLKQNGLGVSVAIGVGGERIIGSDFTDILEVLEHDTETHAAVVFGEIGGNHEERLAKSIREGRITKPVVACIVGAFAAQIQRDTPFGHAGALLEGGRGTVEEKQNILKSAGVHIAHTFDEIPNLLRLCQNKNK